jgi:hypothetical protein
MGRDNGISSKNSKQLNISPIPILDRSQSRREVDRSRGLHNGNGKRVTKAGERS